MAVPRYIKKRRSGWYFQIAVPEDVRDKGPWGGKPVIIQTLQTRDEKIAARKAHALVAEWHEKFDRARGDIALTRTEINEQAWTIYKQTRAQLEAKLPTGEPEGDETPEEAGLIAVAWQYEEALEQEDFEIVAADIQKIAEQTGSPIIKDSETWDLLGAAICRAKLAAYYDRRNREQDKPPSEPPVSFVPGVTDRLPLKVATGLPKIKGGKGGPRFSDVAKAFLAYRQRDPNAALIGQTLIQYKMTYRLFEEVTHNAPLPSIDRGAADAFIEVLEKLPPGWGKAKETKGLSLAKVLERSANAETVLTNKTINRHISAMSALFKWAQRQSAYDFKGENPFSNQWRTEASKGATRWLPYKVEELNKLFAAEPTPTMRWIMLVALFSGMRLNEICQLRTDDVQQEQRIWFFNVGAEHEGQRVKSEAGFRRVPIHSQIIKAGLLDYIKRLKPGQLWPDLKPGGPDRKLSWYVTRGFTAFRRKAGVIRARVNFHSLRKNFVTCLDNADGVSQADVAAIVGHERGFTFDRYSEGKGLPAMKAVVEKAKYPGLKL